MKGGQSVAEEQQRTQQRVVNEISSPLRAELESRPRQARDILQLSSGAFFLLLWTVGITCKFT